ncbi:glucuronide uptake porin UidC [Erwiniaceae bacterium BAC15a-03b]|uniref:Glucuronide uptake porin UidC n=1 Tax=Winslowiella arboricola TaxID=2978220 RepID=A0A9J6PP43_9GAMM|nr:glucuronide uptake porin UidC [Winslowiella arboricola]MCU5771647.1 glucuronide uptake porin UidC [Winslowiella arboricola]MCU5776460.1 glucuronide uptake porin UidC [Winslowiella arboricola]
MKYITKTQLICGVVFCLSYQAVASSFDQQEDVLRLRVRNELRRAEKPSAGDGKDIYAWVQGLALEYNSRYYQDIIGVDIGDFYVYKLGARDNWSSRWYLDGHDSFNRYTAAVKINLSPQLQFKVGRMVTDTQYSGGDDLLIMNSSSQRTVPSLSDAALLKYQLNPQLDIYAMYRFGVYNYSDVAEGVHKTGPINTTTLKHDLFRPQYISALAWRRQCESAGAAVSWQQDVALQLMTKAAGCIPVADDPREYLKPEFMAFYARMNGLSVRDDSPDYGYVVSGQLSYIAPPGSLFLAAARTGDRPHWSSGVDTDLGYPFDLSIDRNHNDMWSWQAGGTVNLPGDTFVGVAQVMTRGYEDYQHRVPIHGMGTNLLFGYRPQDGMLKGLKALLILNKAREHRNGSSLGDRLDYYDIKMNLQYDFTLK